MENSLFWLVTKICFYVLLNIWFWTAFHYFINYLGEKI